MKSFRYYRNTHAALVEAAEHIAELEAENRRLLLQNARLTTKFQTAADVLYEIRFSRPETTAYDLKQMAKRVLYTIGYQG